MFIIHLTNRHNHIIDGRSAPCILIRCILYTWLTGTPEEQAQPLLRRQVSSVYTYYMFIIHLTNRHTWRTVGTSGTSNSIYVVRCVLCVVCCVLCVVCAVCCVLCVVCCVCCMLCVVCCACWVCEVLGVFSAAVLRRFPFENKNPAFRTWGTHALFWNV
jgi:hypothetical protein